MDGNFERTARIVLAEDHGFGVNVSAFFSVDDETYEEIKYHHIMTESHCDSPRQILQGWSEMNEEDNKKWTELVRRLEEAVDLALWLAGDEEGSEGTLEIQENGILSRARE